MNGLSGSHFVRRNQRELVGIGVGLQGPEHFVPFVQLDFFAALVGVLVVDLEVPGELLGRLATCRFRSSPRPNSERKWSVTNSGRRDGVSFEAWLSAPSAVAPFTCTDLPLPPVPPPRQVAFGLVLIEVVLALTNSSASALPPLPTTRTSTRVPLPAASAAVESNSRRASAHAATSRNGTSLGI